MLALPTSFVASTVEKTANDFSEDDASSSLSASNSPENSTVRSTIGSSLANQRVRDRTPRQNRLTGHPCAAGCGHFCWATNINGGVDAVAVEPLSSASHSNYL